MRVAIVGGGIGGLSAALFCLRAGLDDVAVYEQAPELKEIGAGIQTAPNAMRLLRRLGLGGDLERVGVRLEGGWEFRRWEDGRVLFHMTLGDACERTFGEPYLVVHRADLLDLLAAAVPRDLVRLDHRCVGLEQDEERVTLRFAGGAAETADVVVGADGIHSVVHDGILPPQEPVFSGLSAYRCLVPAAQAPAFARRPVTTLWVGPRRHLVHYPVADGRLVNVVTANPAGAWRTESWTAEGSPDDLRAEFAGWADELQRLLACVRETKRYAFYDREPLERWSVGRVTLLGDAAHPMMPFFAQGASQAIEDGAVLAGCLQGATADTAPAALARYESLRRERATRVQQVSREAGVRHHLPDGPEQRRRDEALAREDPLGHNAWVYGHDVERELVA